MKYQLLFTSATTNLEISYISITNSELAKVEFQKPAVLKNIDWTFKDIQTDDYQSDLAKAIV